MVDGVGVSEKGDMGGEKTRGVARVGGGERDKGKGEEGTA